MKISATQLMIERGEDVVIDGVSFELQNGQAILVKGANGAGKSTLLRGLCGLLPLAAGTIDLTEIEAEFDDVPKNELMHYLGHQNAMKNAMNLAENLTFWRSYDRAPHLDVEEALEMVGLDGLETIPFAHLSTGQKRRASIARLLVTYRPIWLLDEPTAGLDAASQDQFRKLMQAHLEDDGMIIAATHEPLGLEQVSELQIGGVSS